VLLALAARSPEQVAEQARRLAGHLRAHPDDLLADAGHTLAVGRRHFRQRLALVADGRDDAIARLQAAGAAAATAPAAPAIGSIVFAFPGQGAHYPGMASALYGRVPVFRAALDQCAQILAGHGLPDLLGHLASADDGRLRPTAISQPAIFAVEYALARWWQSLAVEPTALIGHSLGEFVAATVAGVFQLEEALRLVRLRGSLMQAQPAGSMLAVRLPASALEPRLAGGLALAAENGPRACVVSGASDAIDRLAGELAAEGVACAPLRTSHAFHCAMMDPVLEPFRRALDPVRLGTPGVPIMSTATGDWLTDAEATDPDYWALHLRRPVRFAQAAARLLQAPGRLLLELGPGTVLGGLFRQAQAGASTIACLPGPVGSEVHAALGAVAAAWQAGVEVDLTRLDRGPGRRRIRLPSYPFARTRHWLPAAAAAAPRPEPVAAAAAGPAVDPAIAPAVDSAVEPIMSQARTDTATAAASAPDQASRRQLVQRLIAVFDEVAGIELDPRDTALGFLEQGVDSLALTQVALQIKADFAVPISFRDLMEDCASLDLLAATLAARMPAPMALPSQQPAPAAAAGASAAAADAPQLARLQALIVEQMAIMSQQLAALSAVASGAPAAQPQPANPNPTPAPGSPPASGLPPPAALADGAAAATDAASEETALAHTRYDVKKAFGAIARIHSGESELTPRQQARLAAFIRRYTGRTARSKAHVQAHRAHLADPRVVNGFRPMFKEIVYQLVVERSSGARLWDLDGNEYIDALNGFGMNLFGWQPPVVTDALRRALDTGYEIGPQHPLAGEVARLVCELTGNDRTALCNTGSEAVMGTVRIARTITGRRLVVVFSGAYHGIFDEVIVRSTSQRRSVPAAPGIMRSALDNVLVLDWGSDEALEVIRQRGDEIAAVLVEPVQSRRPDFQPFDFIRRLRELTAQSGSLLVFDEVVTGFRCHPGGVQALIGVRADLCAYGKVVGGGLPIGVISGKREYMDALDGGWWQFGDDSTPTVGVTYFAGTFVRHPLALVAAQAVLEHLRDQGPALQAQLNERSAGLARTMNDLAERAGAPLVVHNFASVLKLEFRQEHPLQDLLFAMMRSHGIHLLDHFPCFMTTAHGPAEMERIATAFGAAVDEMLESGFMARIAGRAPGMDASRPPVPGARLGRDENRRPAWFVPDPGQPGKFIKVEA
jgi:acyl transferase domain-containing protein